MNDLISRQAAIDAIGNYLKKDGDQLVIADVVDAAVANPKYIRAIDKAGNIFYIRKSNLYNLLTGRMP